MNDVQHIDPQGQDEILLKVDGTPQCPRCGSDTVLLARYQHSWKNNRGEDVPGIKEAVLCRGCDQTDPEAAELLALFTVDEQVTPENLETFGGLAAAWVESVRQRTVDEALLAAQHELWCRGEL
ncbi:hypothetical protein M2271_007271 [Streptomyces sp. LBL]|uniref:DUF6300 family protein n=1 Tax=Streptomyces sp. LBL TaxID=2940562 RepID=UPI00247593E6|nr:DUF6300 family protein [Streptomyces sp. LBL]MDH6629435.1 hypothetical protein [Streptomyces sp. LBL]